jgi:hypothetical protein
MEDVGLRGNSLIPPKAVLGRFHKTLLPARCQSAATARFNDSAQHNERLESIRNSASERNVVDGNNSVRSAIIEFQYRLLAYSAITTVIQIALFLLLKQCL